MSQKTHLSADWSATGTFTGSPYISSLRGKDPKKTSTTTIHLPQSFDASGRCPGIRSHHFGPSQKLVGGLLVPVHEDQQRIGLPRSLDPAEILNAHLHRPATSSASSTGLLGSTTAAGQPARPATTAATSSSSSTSLYDTLIGGGRGANNPKKVVFWNGKSVTVMDKPELPTGAAWSPPHLEARDLAPGHFLGVTEKTGTAGTALVGSKARRLPDTTLPPEATWTGTNRLRQPGLSGPIPPPYGPMKGTYGLPPYAPINVTKSFGPNGNIDEGTLRAYAREKLMGHREYEETCKSLDGMTSWHTSRCYLTSSMSIGHQTRLLAPREHVTEKLSLRR